MAASVNTRRYHSPARRAAADRTRSRILRTARQLFLSKGYAATSVAEIARKARVSVDTVYTSVGRKPELLVAVHDMTLAGGPEPVAAEQRDYVREIRGAPTARLKLEAYAAALGRVLPTSVPLLQALRSAGTTDPACLAVFTSVSDRRAANMRLFVADLRATGELRDDLTDEWVADLVWSMNSPDYFELICSRGCSADQYAALLVEVWSHTLLRGPG
ncbi:MAG: TetR/AcrR family transcriptional regulator [Marmoricola sp.]